MNLTKAFIGLLLACLATTTLAAQPPGHLDPTFGAGGKRTIGFDLGGALSDQAFAIAKAPDGRIYLAGNVTLTPQKVAIGLARILPDGAIDLNFKNGGRVTYLDPLVSTAQIYGAVVQPDGKVVVTGAGKINGDNDPGFLTCRFRDDGEIDTTFGDNIDEMAGCTFLDIGVAAASRSITLLGNGEMILAGYATVNGLSRALLVKLDAGGALKDSFGNGGIRTVTAGWVHAAEFVDVEADTAGQVVAIGTVNLNGVNQDWLIGRFSQLTGASDPNFVGGIKILGFNAGGTNGDVATAVHVRPDRSVLVTGHVDAGAGGIQPAVAKYEQDGSVANFGEGGKQVYDPCESNDATCNVRPFDILSQADGKVVIGGAAGTTQGPATNNFFALRLIANGQRDVTFGTQGGNAFAYHDFFGRSDSVMAMLLQGERVVLGGFATNGANGDFAIARLDHGLATAFTVTPVIGPNGLMTPSTPQLVAHSGHVVFTVMPAPQHVAEVSGCGGVLVGNSFITAPVVANCTVTATFESNVTLRYAAGAHGVVNGGELVELTVPYGSNGPLVTVEPDENYLFQGWSDGNTSNPRQDLAVTGPIDVTAIWLLTSHKVTPIWDASGGTVDPEGSFSVTHGSNAKLVVKPNPGFGVEVSGCGGLLIGNTYVTKPVVANCAVNVNFFASNESFNLNYAGGENCPVQGNLAQVVQAGGNGTLVNVQPDAGYFFVKWSDGSTNSQREDTNVVGDIDVTATCAADGTPIHLVTPKPGDGGFLAPPDAQQVANGDGVQFTVLPLPGFGVTSVQGCPDGTLVGNTYLTGPVFADCEVVATFAPSDTIYTLKYNAEPGGIVNGVTEQQVAAGFDGSTVTAQADNGFFFIEWSDGLNSAERTDTHVVGNIDVTAKFAANGTPIHTVTPLAAEGGQLSPFDPIKIAEGDVTEFKVLPNLGFTIDFVQGCGGVRVGNTYTTGPVTENCTVEAFFTESNEFFLLTYTAGPGGELAGLPNQVVAAGGNGTEVVAQPLAGFFFVSWTDGWAESARTDTNVIGDITTTANFALNGTPVFTVTPVAGAGGAMQPGNPVEVAQGGTAQFQLVPSDGYVVQGVASDCGGALDDEDIFTTGPVNANCVVEATFMTDRIFANDFEVLPP